MNRRRFLGLAGTAVATSCRPRAATARVREQAPTLATVLRGGRCFRQGRWDGCDVGIDATGRLRFGLAHVVES